MYGVVSPVVASKDPASVLKRRKGIYEKAKLNEREATSMIEAGFAVELAGGDAGEFGVESPVRTHSQVHANRPRQLAIGKSINLQTKGAGARFAGDAASLEEMAAVNPS